MLLPKDPRDDRNVIMEIRAGTGGDEAAIFAADLFRLYSHYAESRKWNIEILSSSEIGIGGIKEIIFLVKGKGAYSRLKYESGVHRVQRVPVTESQGRIHTSTATVAVLAEVDEVEINIPECGYSRGCLQVCRSGRSECAERIPPQSASLTFPRVLLSPARMNVPSCRTACGP